MDYLLIVIGIAFLYFGGEMLVKNAADMARNRGIRPLIIGLTVVAFGTSAPELAASVIAVLRDSPEISMGTVVGSNIANLGLILGLIAFLYPITTSARFLRRDVLFMIVMSALMFPLMFYNEIGRLSGAVLVGLFALYIVFLLRSDVEPEVAAEYVGEFGGDGSANNLAIFGLMVGVAMLVGGAQALVNGAIGVAAYWGVPERIIGLTFVAVGTSLPELSSSLVAAMRRENDIVLGNIIGSNIFNIIGVLGLTALVQPIVLEPGIMTVDLAVMLIFSLATLVFLYTGLRLSRAEGGAFMGFYALYVIYLFLLGR